MKKISILIIALFLIAGCNSEASNSNQQTTEEYTFQQPKRNPNVRGTVKSMIGNEITIEVRDMSALPEEIQEMRNQVGSGGRMPGSGGGMGMGRGGGNGMSEEDRQKMREAMENIPTEEHKIIFPVGIPMAKVQRREGVMNFEDASLADIQTGMNVTVWLNQESEDSKIAESVIISARRNGN